MWTIQEVTLAQANKVFVHGGENADLNLQWITLITATDALKAMQYPFGHIEKAVKSQRALFLFLVTEHLPKARAILEKRGDSLVRPLFWPILLDIRGKKSSDPKDKIFALCAVLKKLKIECPQPDYEKPVEDVYRDAVVACINHDQNLYVLFDAPSDHRHARPNLSSWVPDWSDEGWRYNSPDARIAVTRDRFCAAGPADPKWSFSHDQRRLVVSGKIVDSVIYCAEPLYMDMQVVASLSPSSRFCRTQSVGGYTRQDAWRILDTAFQTLKSWADVASWYAEYPTGETVQEALFRTLKSDTPRQNSNENLSFDAWYKTMMLSDADLLMRSYNRLQQQGREEPGTPSQAALESMTQRLPEASPWGLLMTTEASKYHSLVSSFANKRALFTTEEGYMGTAPAIVPDNNQATNMIEAGDKIAVVAGLEMPMVLRPVEMDGPGEVVYRLVTHVYLHGIMYGEAWENGKYEVQEIVLV